MSELRPYQQKGVDLMVKFLTERGCVYNASDMGTGKSAMTICTIKEFWPYTIMPKVLIACPAVVKTVWEYEVKLWKGNFNPEIYSYDKLTRDVQTGVLNFKLLNYDFLICDESHYLKNRQAKRTKVLLARLWDRCKYKICLSGTPFTQSIMDCWPIFSRMAPEDFPKFHDFGRRYCNITSTPWGDKYDGVRNHVELREIINKKFFFRFLKKDVEKELPPKTYQRILLPDSYRLKLTADQAEAHKQYVELLKKAIAAGGFPPPPPIAIATQIKEQGLKKVPAILEFSKNILDSGEALVIFAWHSSVIAALKQGLEKYEPQIIEGSTSEKDRQKAVESFQAGISTCFIGQLKASGTGITLTRSATAILAELSWSPSDNDQAVARIDRIGQKKNIMIYTFPVMGSIDEKIEEVVLNKQQTFSKVLNQ